MRIGRAIGVALMLAAVGCERIERRETDRERSDGLYRQAMSDYTAGRLEPACQAFEKVVRGNPANASARFQFACLLQEFRRDYIGAIGQYREYLLQRPESDKADTARERLELCERLLAPQLAKKLKIADNSALVAEAERLRDEVKDLTRRNDDLGKRLERAEARIEEYAKESERLHQMIAATDEGGSAPAPTLPTEAELLDVPDGAPTVDRAAVAGSIGTFEAEEAAERTPRPFALPDASKPVVAAPVAESPREPPHEKRPKTYVVQDGDTLYRLAIRFYGQRSAWKVIRDANKAIISTDGRLRTGQALVFP